MSEDVRPYGAGDERDDNAAARVAELRALTEQLGESQRGIARALELDERTMRYYFSGQHPTPLAVVYALRYLALLRSANATNELARASGSTPTEAVNAFAASRRDAVNVLAKKNEVFENALARPVPGTSRDKKGSR